MNKFLLISLLIIISYSQNFKESKQIQFLNSAYKIERNILILPETIIIYNNEDSLKESVDYRFYQINNTVRLINKNFSKGKYTLEYHYLPIKKNFKLSKIKTIAKKSSTDALIKNEKTKTENVFKNLNKSGSIFRSFRLNSNQDLVFESGINLSINGKITDDLEINAVLNDESSPIQPEGSSQRISEIDKVYLELKHRNFSTTVGDYNYHFSSNNNLEFKRRLSGLKLNFTMDSIRAESNFSSARSNFNRMFILTRDAVQGPYKLEAKNKNKDIVVIAGSEKVYLDGKQLKRGINHNYTMEYSNGSILFTSKNLIKANQELIIEYQYVESFQRFQQSVNVHSVNYNSKHFKGKLTFLSEKDDIENPLNSEEDLDPFERDLIKSAGNDIAKASYSSIRLADGASGFYDYIYSNTFNDSILIYKVDQSGSHNATFSHIGTQNGRYERLSKFDNQYKYVGNNKGAYEPIILLSIPEKNEIFYSENQYKTKNLTIELNSALNNLDQNTLSNLDNKSKKPVYINSKLQYDFNIKNFKKLRFSHTINYRDQSFQFFDASIPVYFSNQYGIRETISNPFLKEIKNSLGFQRDKLSINLFYDQIKYKSSINAYSYRLRSAYNFSENDEINFFINRYKTKDNSETFQSDYFNSYLGASIKESLFQFYPKFKYQDRKIKDGLNFRIQTIDFENETKYQVTKNLKLAYIFNYTKQSLTDTNSLDKTMPFSESYNHGLTAHYRRQSISNSFSIKYRDFEVSDFFKNLNSNEKTKYFYLNYVDTNYQSQKSYLIENKFSANAFKKKLSLRLNYRANSELISKKELIYRKVAKGIGNYRLENGIYIPDSQGDYIQFVLPTNDFESVHKVSTTLIARLNEFNRKKDDIFSNIAISSRLKLSDENKSGKNLQVYSYSPSTFFSSSSLNSSIDLNNILSIYRGRKTFRFEYQQIFQKSLTNSFSNDFQGNNNSSRTHSNRFSFFYLISTNIQAVNSIVLKDIIKNVATNPDFNRNINALSVNQEINYSLSSSFQLKNIFEYKFEENMIPLTAISANSLGFRFNAKYLFENQSFINANYQYANIKAVKNPNKIQLPYEMLNGKRIGLNQEWSVESLYKISKEFFAKLNYTGRKDVIDKDTFHLFKFELRVIF